MVESGQVAVYQDLPSCFVLLGEDFSRPLPMISISGCVDAGIALSHLIASMLGADKQSRCSKYSKL